MVLFPSAKLRLNVYAGDVVEASLYQKAQAEEDRKSEKLFAKQFLADTKRQLRQAERRVKRAAKL
jgi:hypothetical protein